jgi:hypothetical protein
VAEARACFYLTAQSAFKFSEVSTKDQAVTNARRMLIFRRGNYGAKHLPLTVMNKNILFRVTKIALHMEAIVLNARANGRKAAGGRLLKAGKLSQAEIARQLGISRATVSD